MVATARTQANGSTQTASPIIDPSRLRPLEDCVLIRRIPKGETAGGLILPDDAKIGLDLGEVVAVGPGFRTQGDGALVPMDVKKGDLVYLHFRYNVPIDFEGKDGGDYCVARSRDLLMQQLPE